MARNRSGKILKIKNLPPVPPVVLISCPGAGNRRNLTISVLVIGGSPSSGFAGSCLKAGVKNRLTDYGIP